MHWSQRPLTPEIEEMRQRRREAAERVRRALTELAAAELEFEMATAELKDAVDQLESDAA
jgi:hypothetical protein